MLHFNNTKVTRDLSYHCRLVGVKIIRSIVLIQCRVLDARYLLLHSPRHTSR